MKSLSWKNVLIGLLLGLNITVLASIWMTNKKIDHRQMNHHESPMPEGPKHNRPEPHNRIEHVFKSELGFSDDQMKQFKILKEEHRENTKKYLRELKELKKEMFTSISDENNINGEAITKEIGEKQTALELLTLHHFTDLRNLCNEDQKKQFDEILDQMSKRFSKHQKPPMKPH